MHIKWSTTKYEKVSLSQVNDEFDEEIQAYFTVVYIKGNVFCTDCHRCKHKTW